LAIQGLWTPASLPFLQLNNTTLVVLKVRGVSKVVTNRDLKVYTVLKMYATLVLAVCIVALLCYPLPGESPSCGHTKRHDHDNISQSSYPESGHLPLVSACIIPSFRPYSSKLRASFRSRLEPSSKRQHGCLFTLYSHSQADPPLYLLIGTRSPLRSSGDACMDSWVSALSHGGRGPWDTRKC